MMPVLNSDFLIFANILGGWELVLILAVILIVSGAKWLPEIMRGVGDGVSQFRKELDGEAQDAGKSLGGIYGKPAAEALTPDNQTAELYNPATGVWSSTGSLAGARVDHIATLLEVMAGLARGDFEADFSEQTRFFERHLKPWAARMFADLELSRSANFYRAVGRVGRIFMELESEAFTLSE